jgi:hypothetical protein
VPPIVSEKKNRRSPEIIAPIMLVAANVIPRSTIAVITVPRIPIRTSDNPLQQLLPSEIFPGDARSNIAKYTTAIPNTTHKNAGVMVIRAIPRKIPATIPIITLAKITRG